MSSVFGLFAEYRESFSTLRKALVDLDDLADDNFDIERADCAEELREKFEPPSLL